MIIISDLYYSALRGNFESIRIEQWIFGGFVKIQKRIFILFVYIMNNMPENLIVE